jgi:class 3 adenylate cyclase
MDLTSGTNRTWLCTVVFMDIVGYSKCTVAKQLVMKDQLNTYISDAIQQVDETSRVILDTGDGAAICFLGDPEDALFCALGLRSALNERKKAGEESFDVRIGINLGPIKLVKDLNGNLNAVGDGINDAQRVMSFAGPQEILVSRSFYDVVGRISEEINRMFSYSGVRKDKHVREHAIYSISGSSREEPEPDASVPTPLSITQRLPEWALSDEAEAQITTALASYIGPLAKILVRKTSFKADSAEDFLKRLSTEIEAPGSREAFLRRARRIVARG